MENLIKSDCLIYILERVYHGDILFRNKQVSFSMNTAIDIVDEYQFDSHKFRLYTTNFNKSRFPINSKQLDKILDYGRLYHFFIPCAFRFNWFYNVAYIQFHDPNRTLFFTLEYPHMQFNSSDKPNLYREFMESYREYLENFK